MTKPKALSDVEIFAARLREVRARTGLTREKFAKLAQVNQSTQGTYERAMTWPSTKYFQTLHRAGVDILYLITGTTSSTPPPPPINYKALAQIGHLVVRWGETGPVKHDKADQLHFLQMFYEAYLGSGRLDLAAYMRTLHMVDHKK